MPLERVISRLLTIWVLLVVLAHLAHRVLRQAPQARLQVLHQALQVPRRAQVRHRAAAHHLVRRVVVLQAAAQGNAVTCVTGTEKYARFVTIKTRAGDTRMVRRVLGSIPVIVNTVMAERLKTAADHRPVVRVPQAALQVAAQAVRVRRAALVHQVVLPVLLAVVALQQAPVMVMRHVFGIVANRTVVGVEMFLTDLSPLKVAR